MVQVEHEAEEDDDFFLTQEIHILDGLYKISNIYKLLTPPLQLTLQLLIHTKQLVPLLHAELVLHPQLLPHQSLLILTQHPLHDRFEDSRRGFRIEACQLIEYCMRWIDFD